MWNSRNLSQCSSVVASPTATTPTFSEGGVKRKVVEGGGGGAASAKEETSLQGSLLSRLACCSAERRGSPIVFGMNKMIDLTFLACSIGEAFFFFRTLFPSPRSKGKPLHTLKTAPQGAGRGPNHTVTTSSPPRRWQLRAGPGSLGKRGLEPSCFPRRNRGLPPLIIQYAVAKKGQWEEMQAFGSEGRFECMRRRHGERRCWPCQNVLVAVRAYQDASSGAGLTRSCDGGRGAGGKAETPCASTEVLTTIAEDRHL